MMSRSVLLACLAAVAFAVPAHLTHSHLVPHLESDIDSCFVCKEIVSLIDSQLVQNKTETEIANIVNDFCTFLASSPLKELAPVCNEVSGNLPTILQLIAHEASPELVCTSVVKECSSGIKVVKPAAPVDLNIDGCDVCQEVVTLVEDALARNTTQTEIAALTSHLCSLIGNSSFSQYAVICEQIADNIPQVISLLEQELPPATVCSMVGLCAGKAKAPVAPMPQVASGLTKCDICEEVVGLAESALQNNSTQQEIEGILNKLCTALADSPLKEFAPVCTEIASNVPLLVQLLEQELPADKICQLLKFCTATTTQVQQPAKSASGLDKCDICQEVVSLAEGALQSNKTESEIETILNELCTAIANSPLKEFAPICQQIAGNVPLLVQLLESELPPEKVCSLLKICNSTETKAEIPEPVKSDLGIDQCDVCKEVVSLAEGALQQNKTETEIQSLLDELCAVLANSPLSKFAGVCNEIASNVPLLIQLLEQELPPEEVCSLAKQCPSSHFAKKVTIKKTYSMGSCDVCKELVSLAEYELTQQQTEQEITNLLHGVCAALANTPLAPLATQCNALADQVPQLIPMIENHLTPDAVCVAVKQCSA